jgi:hypothetical protein
MMAIAIRENDRNDSMAAAFQACALLALAYLWHCGRNSASLAKNCIPEAYIGKMAAQ